MIYWVDEDDGPLRPLRLWLGLELQREISSLRFADTALDLLVALKPESRPDLVLVDLMLATSRPDERFNAQRTSDHLETGVVLCEHLLAADPPWDRSRLLILTHTTLPGPLRRARSLGVDVCSKDHGSREDLLALIRGKLAGA